MAERKGDAAAAAPVVSGGPSTDTSTIPIGELKELLLGENSPIAEQTDYLFAKASRAAAVAVQDLFAYGERVR